MNEIVRSVTPEIGFDKHGQLWHVHKDGSSTVSTVIRDPRGHVCALCGRGWEVRTESLVDHLFFEPRKDFVHESCYVRFLSFEEQLMWHDALVRAGICFDSIYEIKNGYGGAWNTPWYRTTAVVFGGEGKVKRELADLKFGRRKRVWEMEMRPALVTSGGKLPEIGAFSHPEAFEALKKEDVTKEIEEKRVLIHAWNEAKVLEYMKVFARAIGVAP